jgi:hypothetical protein
MDSNNQRDKSLQIATLIVAAAAFFCAALALALRWHISNILAGSPPHSFEGGHGFVLGLPLFICEELSTLAVMVAIGCLLAQRWLKKRIVTPWNITSASLAVAALCISLF